MKTKQTIIKKGHVKYIFAVIILGLVFVVTQYIKNSFTTYNARAELLKEKWKTARNVRMLWKEAHTQCFDFNDQEYQELWNIEIGAEDLYLLYDRYGWCISWGDYKFEQKEYEREKM